MWAIAATLERGRPVLNDWGMDLHDLGYGRRMVSELFKEEAFDVKFTGPSVSGTSKKSNNGELKIRERGRLPGWHLILRFLAYPLKLDTPESTIVLFFTTKVSSVISVEGGKALSRLLNDKIPNIW